MVLLSLRFSNLIGYKNHHEHLLTFSPQKILTGQIQGGVLLALKPEDHFTPFVKWGVCETERSDKLYHEILLHFDLTCAHLYTFSPFCWNRQEVGREGRGTWVYIPIANCISPESPFFFLKEGFKKLKPCPIFDHVVFPQELFPKDPDI